MFLNIDLLDGSTVVERSHPFMFAGNKALGAQTVLQIGSISLIVFKDAAEAQKFT